MFDTPDSVTTINSALGKIKLHTRCLRDTTWKIETTDTTGRQFKAFTRSYGSGWRQVDISRTHPAFFRHVGLFLYDKQIGGHYYLYPTELKDIPERFDKKYPPH